MLDLSSILKFKILGTLLLFLIVVPLVSAQEVITIPFNQEYDLKRFCFNNGTYCSASAICNLSIYYPHGNPLVNNQVMTNNVSFHNYTLFASQINRLGDHIAQMSCIDSAGDIVGNGFQTFTLKVTGDGFQKDKFPLEFVILGFGILLIIVGKMKEDLSLFQHVGAIIIMVFGVITLYPGYGNINYSNLTGQSLGFGTIGLGFWFMIERFFARDEQMEYYDSQPEEGRF